MPLLLVVLLFCGCGPPDSRPDIGTVTGRTVMIVLGHPGALTGKPDPNWRWPAPKPVPNQLIYCLKVDREHGHQLFTVTSDASGVYEIDLPAGPYLFAAGALHRNRLGWLKPEEASNPEVLIQVLFRSEKQDAQGRAIFVGEPGTLVAPGQTATNDVVANLIYVD